MDASEHFPNYGPILDALHKQFQVDRNCDQCYGRGILWYNKTAGTYQGCACLTKRTIIPAGNPRHEERSRIVTPNDPEFGQTLKH